MADTQDAFDQIVYDSDDDTTEQIENPKPVDKKDGDTYVTIHSSSFREFLLKSELTRAIADCGFEHPSEVQHACIPQAILGTDVICQAKSGMGKTAVFVLAVLQQMNLGSSSSDPSSTSSPNSTSTTVTNGTANNNTNNPSNANAVNTLVLCHTRELAFQICHEFDRFKKYMPAVKTAVFFGGVAVQTNKDLLKSTNPHIVIGTPGRILQLATENALNLGHVKHFVLDECDKLLESLDMRRDVQKIFKKTPHSKQVMMFSATLSEEIRPVCRKFMHNPLEIFVNDGSKLTLHGLQQYYLKVAEHEKNRRLVDLLDALEFNQLIIFVRSVARAVELNKLLVECNFPSICIHSLMKQEERIDKYRKFKEFHSRIMVSTNLFGRGIDIERVNVVINYDQPENSDTYLHRVGRAGRFGTKGLAISFISSTEDANVLHDVQSRFFVNIPPLPDEIDAASYMQA